jgi:lipoprotein-releasing system ATP-binding protein
MPGGEAPLVEARGLAKRYVDGPAEVRVLEDVDLDIAPAERVAIVGESGVGKSTLLHLLGGLDRPSGGSLVIGGVDVFAQPEDTLAAFRNRTIGFVFQFHQLLPDFTALENVVLPALIGREPAAAARRRATALLERVGLAERAAHRPGELSGGEQQRVAVARAVMRKPTLVLADEPTGNLDPETGERVTEVLFELNREVGSALVVVTHNAGLAAAMDRTLRLSGGRVHEDGAARAARRGGRGGTA